MTFLNPAVLVGLLAAAIPIVLHLLNLRKLRTVEFSTLTFLKELQKTRIRRIKIRQWLLLLLRTLLVVALVMAFARPTLEGPLAGAVGERARTTAVIIIDDSYSMTALDSHGELLQQAKQAALDMSDVLNDGDEAYLLRLSNAASYGTEEPPRPFRSILQLRSAINEIKPSYRTVPLEDALRSVASILGASTHLNKEVYLISDFQRGIIEPSSAAQEQLFHETVRIFPVRLGARRLHNLGIDTVRIPNTLLEVGKQVIVQATIRNESGEAVRNYVVGLFINGARAAQRTVDIQAGSTAEVEFTILPRSPGWLTGIVELEPDDLEFDNRRYVALRIPERIRVLLVGTPSDLRYLRLALETRSANNQTALQVREVLPERLSANDMADADVVLFSNPGSLTTTQSDRLNAFVRTGGGLIVFPGSRTQPESFRNSFSDPLNLALLTAIERTGQPVPPEDVVAHFEIDEVDLRHPLFHGMFEEPAQPPRGRTSTQRMLESPVITAAGRYTATPGAIAVMRLSNGAPFLLDQPVENGRVLLYAISATTDWSNFPLKGLFVPLVHRSVSYAGQQGTQLQEYRIGDEVVVRSRSGSGGWIVRSPEAIETMLQPTLTGSERRVRFTGTESPGFYVFKQGMDTAHIAPVNIHPAESRTIPAREEDVNRLFDRLGIEASQLHPASAAALQERVVQARFGTELRKHFLLAALFLAIAEMLIARNSKKELATLPQTGT
jgi:hypothetical protein